MQNDITISKAVLEHVMQLPDWQVRDLVLAELIVPSKILLTVGPGLPLVKGGTQAVEKLGLQKEYAAALIAVVFPGIAEGKHDMKDWRVTWAVAKLLSDTELLHRAMLLAVRIKSKPYSEMSEDELANEVNVKLLRRADVTTLKNALQLRYIIEECGAERKIQDIGSWDVYVERLWILWREGMTDEIKVQYLSDIGRNRPAMIARMMYEATPRQRAIAMLEVLGNAQ